LYSFYNFTAVDIQKLRTTNIGIWILQKYLSKYGYFNPSEENYGLENMRYEDSSMTQAIKEFQSFFGLHQTGEYVVLSESIKNHLRNLINSIIAFPNE